MMRSKRIKAACVYNSSILREIYCGPKKSKHPSNPILPKPIGDSQKEWKALIKPNVWYPCKWTGQQQSGHSLALSACKPEEALALTKTLPTLETHKSASIELTTDVLAKRRIPSCPEDCFFSDNYMDLPPGQKLQITLSKLVSDIQLKSLFDTL